MKKYIVIIFIGLSIAILAYGIKCQKGVDIFKAFSFGVYKDQYFQVKKSPHIAFANDIEKVKKDNMILVSFDQENGPINTRIFGNNLLGHDPSLYREGMQPSYANIDYGAGIWDGKWDRFVKDVFDLAKGIGVPIVRFPGGCGTHQYNWKETIKKKREHYWFGLDEFLRTAEELGAEAVLTVSYFTGDETDAADFVEYLNSPNDGSNPNNGIDWAAERAKVGHEEPYGIKYFEIGNEVWHGNHQDIKEVTSQEYTKRYLKYYAAMKMVDPSIQIGAVLKDQRWNEAVVGIVQNKIDFGIVHLYPAPAWGKSLERMDPEYIFETSLAIPVVKYGHDIEATLQLLREKAGRDIPLAITEYNGGFVQEKPVPYRHSLGNALVNAELLRTFMRPENNILMANHWNFVNEYWGMISNGFNGKYETLNNPYYKRPNYYVFEMYHEHFGDVLIDTQADGQAYDGGQYFQGFIKQAGGKVIDENLAGSDWVITEFPGNFIQHSVADMYYFQAIFICILSHTA